MTKQIMKIYYTLHGHITSKQNILGIKPTITVWTDSFLKR
jgi:hypothetical protein